jgi:hypothetical protein
MIYYDIEYNEKHFVLEDDTEEEATKWMRDKFEEFCEEEGLSSREDVAYVLTMKLDNNDEPHEIDRTEFDLKYEYELSMMEQHCTWGR